MTVGVLLMAYGSPRSADDVVRYYTDIRRGRPPTVEQLADLERRYEVIGGVSPLGALTAAQVHGVAQQLGHEYLVVSGMKHSEPSIERAVELLESAGVERIVGIVLAPHYSDLSVGEYHRRAARAVRSTAFEPVHSWHLHPLLIDALAERVAETRSTVGPDATVVFTAHSLPAMIVERNDPYPSQLQATARAVAERLGLGPDRWRTAWQSAGRTPEPWLGPDILDVVASADRGGPGFVVCPAGFVSDHLETLYDLDHQAATLAADRGVPFGRTRALDADACPILASLVLSTTRPRVSKVGGMTRNLEEHVAGVAALNDPIRRSLYLFVANSAELVSREQAAAAVGVQKTLAAFHLDKLADEGLLEFEFKRLTGRTGPGAGRPSKLYRRSERQIDVSLPPREYDLAGSLLAGAIDAAEKSGKTVRKELERASFEFGCRLGEEAKARCGPRPSKGKQREALLDVLREHGFEPRKTGRDVVLANCPFHALAQQFTQLVCGMNLHLMEGVRSVLDISEGELQPRLEPEPGQCCVKFCAA